MNLGAITEDHKRYLLSLDEYIDIITKDANKDLLCDLTKTILNN
jgi:hypothetical protein